MKRKGNNFDRFWVRGCCTPKFSLPFFFKIFSWGPPLLKDAQELIRQILLLGNRSITRVSSCTRKNGFQGSQECSCQVSCLASQVFPSNDSDDWKLIVLSTKSTMVNIQSNFKIFGQHQHFEVTFIIWSRFDYDSSKKALKSSKVAKLGLP